MEFVSVEENTENDIDVGGLFFADAQFGGAATKTHTKSSPEAEVAEIGNLNEHGEARDAFEEYKIVAEIRPTDCYVLQRMRNAVLVPTYSLKGSTARKIGSPVLVEGNTAKEYSENLDLVGRGCFPAGAENRALEVIY
tara:strand:+ start:3237 stop:3650 length:414 start_codon:yes stop_codon:yes gene_type:complete